MGLVASISDYAGIPIHVRQVCSHRWPPSIGIHPAAFRQKWARPWKRIIGHVGGFNLTPQLPEVFSSDQHLILMGDSKNGGMLVRALQASELLLLVVDEKYPGSGKALVQYAWSPFALEKNVIYSGATDAAGLNAGVETLLTLSGQKD